MKPAGGWVQGSAKTAPGHFLVTVPCHIESAPPDEPRRAWNPGFSATGVEKGKEVQALCSPGLCPVVGALGLKGSGSAPLCLPGCHDGHLATADRAPAVSSRNTPHPGPQGVGHRPWQVPHWFTGARVRCLQPPALYILSGRSTALVSPDIPRPGDSGFCFCVHVSHTMFSFSADTG